MSKYTELELKVFENIRRQLRDGNEMLTHLDLIDYDDDPKQMRGAIASLVKGAIDIEEDEGSNINGTVHCGHGLGRAHPRHELQLLGGGAIKRITRKEALDGVVGLITRRANT